MDFKMNRILSRASLAAAAISVGILSAIPPSTAATPRTAPAGPPAARPLSQLVRGLITAPDSPVLHYELGLAYFRHGILPQAEKEFLSAMHFAQRSRKDGRLEAEIAKAYLRAVRAQRSLTPDLKRLLDLRRSMPEDLEVARWLIEVYLDKGDLQSARLIFLRHPALKQNAEILARWVGTGAAEESPEQLAERFKDLVTLMDVGSESHKLSAARQMIELAGRLPPAAVTAAQRKSADQAFERLKSATLNSEDQLKIHRDYLSVLDQWNVRATAKSLILDMRKRFDPARTDPALMFLLARYQAADGQTDDALISIREAFRLGHEDGAARLIYANLLEKKGRTVEAMNEYVTALEGLMPTPDRKPAEERVEKWMAQLARQPVWPPSAEGLAERATAVMKESSQAQVVWAKRLEMKGQTQQAYDRFVAAAKLDDRSREAREGIARSAILLGRSSDIGMALQRLDLQQVRQLWDRSPTLSVGRRLLAMGDTEPIRRLVRQIALSRAGTADQIALAAELAMAEGQMREAAAWYTQLRLKRLLTDEEESKFKFASGREAPSDTEGPGMTIARKMDWIRGKIETRNFSEADKLNGMIRDLLRDTPEAYSLLGQFEAAMGNRGAAVAAYLQALRSDPENRAAAAGLARLWMEAGDPQRAIDLLMGLGSKSKEVTRLLAQIHAARGEWEMAAGWMEKSVESDPDKMLTAWYWFRAGQIDDAYRYVPRGGLFEAVLDAEAGRIEKLQKENPNLLKVVLGETKPPESGRGKILDEWTASVLKTARVRAAAADDAAVLKLCDSVLKRAPAPEAFYLKGVTYLKIGLYDEARTALEQAAKSPEWSIPSNLKLGQLELILDRPEEALAYLDHAGPGSDPAELILAWGMALAQSKSPEQGEQILRQVASKSARGKFFLGRLLEKQGRTKEAFDLYQSTIKEFGEFIPARFRIGILALAVKDTPAAEQSFTAILEHAAPSDPYHPMARQMLDDLRRRSPKS